VKGGLAGTFFINGNLIGTDFYGELDGKEDKGELGF